MTDMDKVLEYAKQRVATINWENKKVVSSSDHGRHMELTGIITFIEGIKEDKNPLKEG